MTFNEAMKEAFYRREEDLEAMGPLVKNHEYLAIRERLNAALDKIGKEAAGSIEADMQRLLNAHSQYCYRLGLQDGVKLMNRDFLENGIM